MRAKRRETLTAQGSGRVAEPYREIVEPIHVATTYERGTDGSYPGGRVYSRADNPTYDAPEALIASLEGAHAALLFASGEAAAGAFFQALMPGAVLAPRNMYWALRKWLLDFAKPRGLAVEFYDNASIDDLAAKARAVKPRGIWIETPANPTWEVTDIAAASAIAREVGAVIGIDSTVATPLLTRPIELGASIVMHSATKYLNGHSDVIAGALAAARDDALWQSIRYIRGGGGSVLGPFESWLLLRGIRTLHLRVACACSNAMAIAALRAPPEALPRPLSRPRLESRPRGRRAPDVGRLRRDDVAAPQGGRRSGEGVHREAARLQAGDFAWLGREPGRAPRERRGAGNAVPR